MFLQAERLPSELKNCAGFTTAELLVAALFGLIVVATLYGFFRDQTFNLLSQETKTATLEEARGALDIMSRELRNAGAFPVTTDATCTKDGSGDPLRVVAADAGSIQIQSDIDGNGDCGSTSGEFLTYALSDLTGACPNTCDITRQVSAGGPASSLVTGVVIPAGGSFLTYYNEAGGEITPPVLGEDLNTIKRVKITFSIQAANPNPDTRAAVPNISSILSSSVDFRN